MGVTTKTLAMKLILVAGIVGILATAHSSIVVVAAKKADDSKQEGGGVAKASGPPPFFLQDSIDSLCFAGEEFRRCSIDTLFFVVGSPGTYKIHKRPQDDIDSSGQSDGTCVTKKSCDKLDPASMVAGKEDGQANANAYTTDVKLAMCTHCGAKAWNIHGDATTGYVLTES